MLEQKFEKPWFGLQKTLANYSSRQIQAFGMPTFQEKHPPLDERKSIHYSKGWIDGKTLLDHLQFRDTLSDNMKK